MTWEKVVYKRDVLYEQIWSEPILKVAKTYGISNVGLAKICARLGVPRPGRGYWERLRRGKKVSRPPLPSLHPGQEDEYVMERRAKPVLDEGQKTEFELLALRERDKPNRIVVPSELTTVHHTIAGVDRRLRHGGIDSNGIVVARRTKERLSVQVSRENLDRALRVLNTVVKACEERGHEVMAPPGVTNSLTVTILGEPVSVWIEEVLTATEHKPTPAELKANPWKYAKPQFDYHPSGRLAMRLAVRVHWERLRQTWSDSETQRVENLLNNFLTGMVRAAERQRAERLDRERQEREWQEQARIRQENERRQAEERQRAEDLKGQIDRWDRSCRIRAYVADLKVNAQPPGKWKMGDVPLVEWMEWALRYADSIDPVAPIRRDREKQMTAQAE